MRCFSGLARGFLARALLQWKRGDGRFFHRLFAALQKHFYDNVRQRRGSVLVDLQIGPRKEPKTVVLGPFYTDFWPSAVI